jgi:hypothetical protein
MLSFQNQYRLSTAFTKTCFMAGLFLGIVVPGSVAEIMDVTDVNNPRDIVVSSANAMPPPGKNRKILNKRVGYSYELNDLTVKQVEVGTISKENLHFSTPDPAYSYIYQPENNMWIESDSQKPICRSTSTVGVQHLIAYQFTRDRRSDACTEETIILTNQPYAIRVSAKCEEVYAADQVLQTLQLQGKVKPIIAKCP